MSQKFIIREAKGKDIDAVIRIDAAVSLDYFGAVVNKMTYWREVFDYYVLREEEKRFFLVAETTGEVAGFIIGEARAWEFGSPLCGWVFAVEVDPHKRTTGIGQQLFKEICNRMSHIGVTTIRTMVDVENKLTLSFYRSQGMRTGRHIELEMQI
jgi:ribosomal protein S18 acetylase RimI-like enzyme